jgi:hypothetical protein
VCNVMSVVDQSTARPSFAASLGSDLAIVLDVDVVVRRKGVDLVLGELGTVGPSVSGAFAGRHIVLAEEAYVKPLISLNSVVILPPWSVTCFLAL